MSSIEYVITEAEYAAARRFDSWNSLVFWILMTIMLGWFLITGVCAYVLSIPFWGERALGAGMVGEMLRAAPQQGPRARAMEAELQALADRLTGHLQMPDYSSLVIHYIDDDAYDLHVGLGGEVFIHRGLVEGVSSQDELIALLGHAIGHVRKRHLLLGLGGRGAVAAALNSFGFHNPPAAFLGLADGNYERAAHADAAQELEADEGAAQVTWRCFGHVGGLLDFIRRNERENNSAMAAFHPIAPGHAERVRRMARGRGYALDGRRTSLSPQMLALLGREGEARPMFAARCQ